jgi:hypothetical protein
VIFAGAGEGGADDFGTRERGVERLILEREEQMRFLLKLEREVDEIFAGVREGGVDEIFAGVREEKQMIF